jgi:hypothetical protein
LIGKRDLKKIIQIELNEVNFDFVKAYFEKGKLPNLSRLIKSHGLIETESEQAYRELEPWIQWVSAHTGLPCASHRVFRLGDVIDRPDLRQVWEVLEDNGQSVGAISPMNARNACQKPAFFVPDPWTGGSVVGSPILRRFYSAISQLVNDNAQGRVEATSLAWLAASSLRYARPVNYARYLALVALGLHKRWARALLLDLLLSDVFMRETRRRNPDFATLFLNAAAHIQHHHMFDASVYSGPHRNPDWYREPEDPVLRVYELYDTLLGQLAIVFPEHRLLIATGLSQKPHSQRIFYWRLRNHDSFLRELGIAFERVEPRMSRDFLVFCRGSEEAAQAQLALSEVKADDGIALFDVDNRGASLFVMLRYSADMPASLGYRTVTRTFTGLRAKCAFVAIKNGAHDGVGYLIDTDETAGLHPGQVRLTSLFERAIRHFGSPAAAAK